MVRASFHDTVSCRASPPSPRPSAWSRSRGSSPCSTVRYQTPLFSSRCPSCSHIRTLSQFLKMSLKPQNWHWHYLPISTYLFVPGSRYIRGPPTKYTLQKPIFVRIVLGRIGLDFYKSLYKYWMRVYILLIFRRRNPPESPLQTSMYSLPSLERMVPNILRVE